MGDSGGWVFQLYIHSFFFSMPIDILSFDKLIPHSQSNRYSVNRCP